MDFIYLCWIKLLRMKDSMKPQLKYARVLLKLSGESLGGGKGTGIDPVSLEAYALSVKELVHANVKVAIVVGGGNIFRGLSGVDKGFDRVIGDKMGMLATTINSLAVAGELRALGVRAEVFSATPMQAFAWYYNSTQAREMMDQGAVVIISGGTGNPFFTTDSASALRAIELGVDVFLKGTRVDGVYTADPEKDPKAVKYDTLTFSEALAKNLRIMDLTAFTLCKENNMPVVVFDMNHKGNVLAICQGAPIGTIINN